MHLGVQLNKNLAPKVRTFFESVCPLLFAARAEFCRQVGGRYRFRIRGDGGGDWVLDFATLQVLSGDSAADNNLTVTMSAVSFVELLQGTLDVPVAMADGRLSYEGERSCFFHLATFTNPLPA
jgi:SCP-2 sterol transfer family